MLVKQNGLTGGQVVFQKLWEINRERILLGKFSGARMPVVYGSTGLINPAELFQLIGLGRMLGLPTQFDSMTIAHNVKYHWNRSIEPSLQLFKKPPFMNVLGLKGTWRLIRGFDGEKFFSHLKKMEWHSAEILESLYVEGMSLGDFYIEIAKLITDVWLTNDLVTISSTQELFLDESFLGQNPRTYGSYLQAKRERQVSLMNKIGRVIKTGNPVPYRTWRDAIADGYWPSGAVIYEQIYASSVKSPMVMMVKDSHTGNVHMQAAEYLRDANLYVSPVQLVRLRAVGQKQDHIDLLVLLEILQRQDAPENLLEQIIAVMGLPINADHKWGQEKIIKLNMDGIDSVTIEEM